MNKHALASERKAKSVDTRSEIISDTNKVINVTEVTLNLPIS